MESQLPVPVHPPLHLLLLDNQSRDGRALEVVLHRSRDPLCAVERQSRLSRAVQRLGRNDPVIDVVVTELTLADAKGDAVIRAIREAAPEVALVVVVNTPQEARAVSVADYLLKGYHDRFTLGRILAYAAERRKLLQRIADLEEQLQPALASNEETVPLLTLVLDRDAIAADWQSLGAETIHELVTLFRTSTRETVQQILLTAEQRNTAEVAKFAHLLASAAASLHLLALAQISRQIEQSCISGRIPTALIRQLPDQYQQALEALNHEIPT